MTLWNELIPFYLLPENNEKKVLADLIRAYKRNLEGFLEDPYPQFFSTKSRMRWYVMSADEGIEKWVLELKIGAIHGRKSIAWDLAALRYAGFDIESAKEFLNKYYDGDRDIYTLRRFYEIIKKFAEFEKVDPEGAEGFVALVKEEVVCNALKEKGDEWVMAALIEGSIGYHTPAHARDLVERFKKGYRYDYCERCICCYNCELDTMMFFDVLSFERLEKRDPEKVKRLIEFIKKVEKLDWERQIAVSLMYPTMSI